MAYFALKLHPPRPTFPSDATEAELAAMQRHFGYWGELTAKRTAIAVGPVADPSGSWGLALIEVEDEREAGAISAADPVVTSGLGFRYDILQMPSLLLRANG